MPIMDILGIGFGHLYVHSNTVGLLKAPKPLVNWYKKSNSKFAASFRSAYKKIATDFVVAEED